ncbi:hypothetical protein B0A53_03800 [Rhodotorula sp. CCFEE 5036]|nr:hypothetical protein B0A53_03800 [Rhodotorula sp. CCFEE 5036]
MEQAFMAGRQARAARAVAKARSLITKGKTHQRNRDQLNAEAAQYIFDENNKVQPTGWVDLHGLHVHEAVKFTQQALEDGRARVSAYALAPAAPASLGAVVLLATTTYAMRTTFKGPACRGEKAVALALVWLALAVGTATSLVLSNSTLSTTFSASSDIVAALFLYTFTTTVIPILGVGLLGAAVPAQDGSSLTRISLAGLVVALAGSVYEHVSGIGRVGWWIRASQPGHAYALEWAQRGGGPVLVDWVVGASAFALAQLVWISLNSATSAGSLEGGDLLHHDVGEEAPGAARWKSRRKPVYFLLGLALFALLAPLLPEPRTRLVHPSPSDGSYVYPPLHVGCVSPPFEGKHGLTVDDWLKETTVWAGRGVKVLSWSEGAICDMYKVHVLATYTAPPAADSARHQLLNVATLVGPREDSSHNPDENPNIVFTTTKHHPVPFVESYSHAVRAVPELGSVAGALPLARIAVPHSGHHTPSPHLTPPQRITVSAAICQDAAYPGLTSSLSVVGGDDHLQAAQLLLNPSATPASLSGFGALSLAQARARAIEHGAFLLRIWIFR